MNKIAIIGYNNQLSKNILELLSLRGYGKNNISVFETKVQGEPKVSFGEEELIVKSLENADVSGFDAVVFVGNNQAPSLYAKKFASQGIKVINATTALEGEENIPLVVGGVNDNVFDKAQNIINIPQPSIVQLLGAIAGLCGKYSLKNIRLTSFVAADFEGQEGMSELYNRTRRILMNDVSSNESGLFHKTLAFNVIPQVGSFIGEETYNEWLYNSQIKQVLSSDIRVHANCTFVPSFVGTGQFVNIETNEDIDADEAREDIKKAKGVLVLDRQEDGGYATLTDVQGESSVFVSRIRQDMTVENGISLWIAGDTYKIAAQNILAVLKQFLKKDK